MDIHATTRVGLQDVTHDCVLLNRWNPLMCPEDKLHPQEALRSFHHADLRKENATYVASIMCRQCGNLWHLYDTENIPARNTGLCSGVLRDSVSTLVDVGPATP